MAKRLLLRIITAVILLLTVGCQAHIGTSVLGTYTIGSTEFTETVAAHGDQNGLVTKAQRLFKKGSNGEAELIRSDFAATDGLVHKIMPGAVNSAIQAGGLVGFGAVLRPASYNNTTSTTQTGGGANATGGEGGGGGAGGTATATGGVAAGGSATATGGTANANAAANAASTATATATGGGGGVRPPHPPHPTHPTHPIHPPHPPHP